MSKEITHTELELKATVYEAVSHLKEANNEIKMLRRKNELMSARLQVFDDVMLLAKARISDSGLGHAPNLCYTIDKFIEVNS